MRKRTALKPRLWGVTWPLILKKQSICVSIHFFNKQSNYWTIRQSLRLVASKATALLSTRDFLKSNSNLCLHLSRTIIGEMIHNPNNNFQKHFWHVPIFSFSWLLWRLSQQETELLVTLSVVTLLACTHHPGLLSVEVKSDCCLYPVSGQISPCSLDYAFQVISFTQVDEGKGENIYASINLASKWYVLIGGSRSSRLWQYVKHEK